VDALQLVDGSRRSSVKHRVAVVEPGQDETAGDRLRQVGCEQTPCVTDGIARARCAYQQGEYATAAAAAAMDNSVDGPTAQDVARHHGRWNTGSAVLALYTHDWKFSVPLKHFLCRPHSQRVPGNSVALAGRSL